MTATVRIFSHAGIVTPKHSGPAMSGLSMPMLKQPYLAGEVLTASTVAAVSSAAATAPTATTLLFLQVQEDKRVYYEVTPAGAATVKAATTSSPIIYGSEPIAFGPEWRISVLEVS